MPPRVAMPSQNSSSGWSAYQFSSIFVEKHRSQGKNPANSGNETWQWKIPEWTMNRKIINGDLRVFDQREWLRMAWKQNQSPSLSNFPRQLPGCLHVPVTALLKERLRVDPTKPSWVWSIRKLQKWGVGWIGAGSESTLVGSGQFGSTVPTVPTVPTVQTIRTIYTRCWSRIVFDADSATLIRIPVTLIWLDSF